MRNQCLKVKEALGTEALTQMYQRTGAPLHTAYAPVQLKDLYERKPNECQDVKRWLSIAGICISRWTHGDLWSMPLSYSEASWTGMLDFRTGCWDEECLDILSKDCRESLPSVGDGIFEIGVSSVSADNGNGNGNGNGGVSERERRESRNSYLERWPEMGSDDGGPACRFLSGYGDGACANIGTKCTSMDRIAVTIGTSAAARICLPLPLCDAGADTDDSSSSRTSKDGPKRRKLDDRFVVPHGLFCYRINCDTVLLGGALTDGGSVIAWLRNLFNLKSEHAFLECHQEADASYSNICCEHNDDASVLSANKNLVFVPFLSGERSTGYRENANGCMMGLSLSTTAADLLQESMESVVLRINAILSLIRSTATHIASSSQQLSMKDACIITSGNALEKNELWRRMLADCSNMNVVVDSDTSEGTSRGATLLVANALVNSSDSFTITDINAKEELAIKCTSEPNNSRKLYWTKKKQEQEAFISKMESLWNGEKYT